MAFSLFPSIPYKALVRGSRISLGSIKARGVPAILLGVAGIVCATGLAQAIARAPAFLPETLRETRELWRALRGDRRPLPP